MSRLNPAVELWELIIGFRPSRVGLLPKAERNQHGDQQNEPVPLTAVVE